MTASDLCITDLADENATLRELVAAQAEDLDILRMMVHEQLGAMHWLMTAAAKARLRFHDALRGIPRDEDGAEIDWATRVAHERMAVANEWLTFSRIPAKSERSKPSRPAPASAEAAACVEALV